MPVTTPPPHPPRFSHFQPRPRPAGERIAPIPACESVHLAAAAAARDRSSPPASPPPQRIGLDPFLSYPRTGDLVGERPAMSGVFGKVFGKSKAQSQATALASIDKLSETLEMLEKKENLLVKKANLEVEKAKTFTKAKNKRAAIQCLKRKRLYEQQIEQLGNFQLRIHDQMIMLEGAKATTETVDALRTGASAMKAMHKATNIDDVDKTMDEINDNMENMRQIQDLLSAPIGAAADFDEDELEAELADLEGEELEAELLAPTTTAPTAPVRVQQPTRPSAQSSKTEDDELAALQAEMAM
uniref:Charged multivesicular body protein 4b n=1 Tax=Oryza meridionalis TaxID=40149 RepID=A0A0E0E3S2_9ORYZ